MNIIFNLNKIQTLINNFYKLTNLVVTFCDSEFTHITSSGYSSDFCSLIKTKHCSQCNECDLCGLIEAKKRGSLYSYVCHAGLIESVIPIFYHNIIIAYIMVGQYRDEATRRLSCEQMLQLTKKYDFDKEELLNKYLKQPILSGEQIESMFEIIESFITLMWKEKLIKSQDSSLYAQVSSYIDTNLKESIHIEDLCQNFFISKNALYKLVTKNANMTPNELILSKRLKYASQLLSSTDYTITRIAEECGFSSQNYFIRAFKKNYGISPLQFKKEIQGNLSLNDMHIIEYERETARLKAIANIEE